MAATAITRRTTRTATTFFSRDSASCMTINYLLIILTFWNHNIKRTTINKGHSLLLCSLMYLYWFVRMVLCLVFYCVTHSLIRSIDQSINQSTTIRYICCTAESVFSTMLPGVDPVGRSRQWSPTVVVGCRCNDDITSKYFLWCVLRIICYTCQRLSYKIREILETTFRLSGT